MVIKEIRLMSTASLRKLCIERNWFTCGTITEYEHLLDMTGDYNIHIGPLTLYDMAAHIMDHSSEEAMEGILITDIMTALARICISTFEIDGDI